MISFLIVLHILVCLLLMVSILMQSSKGSGLAGVFGGGGGFGGVFGGRGAATFLSKVSLWLGIAYAVTTLSIGLLSLRNASGSKGLIEQAAESERAASPASALPTVPAQPAAPQQGSGNPVAPEPSR